MRIIQPTRSVKSYLIDQDEGGSVANAPIHAPFRIGRREGFDLCIPSPNVSGLHAEILEEDGELWLHDLNSTNGTFVNDRRIKDRIKLQDSDSIVFGNRRFRVILAASDRTPMATVPNASAMPPSESPKQKFQRLLDSGAVPYFQPIHEISSKLQRLIGYEVLGRSRIFGLNTPEQMFAAAIPLEMESELSRVLRQRGIEAAKNKLPSDLKLFVNTHSAELEHNTLGKSLQNLREAYPTRPVVLELSEKSLNDPGAFTELRSMLRDLDIGLALHDFSAGKIHLAELNEIAPDIVKFDCALLQGVNRAPQQRQRLIRAMVKMVKEIGITPMAEYVESNEEHESLIQLGFEYAQGFYYGRPIDVETVSTPVNNLANEDSTDETANDIKMETLKSEERPLEILKRLEEPDTTNLSQQDKVATPAVSSSEESSDSYRDFVWILQQPENHYTIQLTVSPSQKFAEQFIAKQAEPGNYAIVLKHEKNRELFVVLHGSYENRAIAKLKAEKFKTQGIFALIRRLSEVQDEVQQPQD